MSDAISGVTLNLLGTTHRHAQRRALVTRGRTTPRRSSPTSRAFVAAYNTLQSTLASLGSYDATTGTAGPLHGQSAADRISRTRSNETLYSLVGTSIYNSLASIGITTNSDGSLSVNSTTLQNALSSNFSAVSQLFSGTNGVAATLNSQHHRRPGERRLDHRRQPDADLAGKCAHAAEQQLKTQMAALTASLTAAVFLAQHAAVIAADHLGLSDAGVRSLPTVQGIARTPESRTPRACAQVHAGRAAVRSSSSRVRWSSAVSAYARNSKLAAYQSVSVHGGVAQADPHRLVLMLMDGVARAAGHRHAACIEQRGDSPARRSCCTAA